VTNAFPTEENTVRRLRWLTKELKGHLPHQPTPLGPCSRRVRQEISNGVLALVHCKRPPATGQPHGDELYGFGTRTPSCIVQEHVVFGAARGDKLAFQLKWLSKLCLSLPPG
jgi:hypothetical protein